MTPTDCLKAGPAELALIVAEMMGVKWQRFDHNETLVGVIHNDQPDGERLYPAHYLADAFRLQDRVAEIYENVNQHSHTCGYHCIMENYAHFLMLALGMKQRSKTCMDTNNFMRMQTHELVQIARASPLDRTRAACAAFQYAKAGFHPHIKY